MRDYLLGSDVLGEEAAIGFSWSDLGKNVFGVVHTAGSVVLSAFGAGGVAQAITPGERDAGLLPDWADPETAARSKATRAAQAQAQAQAEADAKAKAKAQRDAELALLDQAAQARVAAAISRGGALTTRPTKNVIPVTVPSSFRLDSQGSTNMADVNTILGDLGLTDSTYLAGTDLIGAPAPKSIKAGAPRVLPGAGGAARRAGLSPHKLVMDKVKTVASSVKSVGSKGVSKATGFKPAQLKPAARAKVSAPSAKLSPKQSVATQRFNQANARAAMANQRLASVAKRAVDVANSLEAFRNKYKGTIDKFLKPGGRTSVQGIGALCGDLELDSLVVDTVLGVVPRFYVGDHRKFYVGEYGVWPQVPDPTNPGFLMDGTPDPGAGGAGGGTTPTGDGAAPGRLPPYDPNTDPDLVPMPVRGQPLDLHNLRTPASAPPPDAIWYDWTNNPYNTTSSSVGSANRMLEPDVRDGFAFNSKMNWFDAYRSGRSNHDESRGGDMGNPEGKGGDVAVNKQSAAYGWGPLVGNPQTQFAGLQMAANGQWFWYPENAPTWATQEADRILAAANQKISEAKRAQIDAYNAQVDADWAATQAAKAKQDAENALAESAAAQQLDIDSSRLLLQQQEQADALALRQQQIELDAYQQWLQANPDAIVAQPQDDGGGASDDGSGTPDGVNWGDLNPRDSEGAMR